MDKKASTSRVHMQYTQWMRAGRMRYFPLCPRNVRAASPSSTSMCVESWDLSHGAPGAHSIENNQYLSFISPQQGLNFPTAAFLIASPRALLHCHRLHLLPMSPNWPLFAVILAIEIPFSLPNPLTVNQQDDWPFPHMSRVPYGTDATEFEPLAVISRSANINVYQVRLKSLLEDREHFAMRVYNRQWVLDHTAEKERLEGELKLLRTIAAHYHRADGEVEFNLGMLYCFYNVCSLIPSPLIPLNLTSSL